MPVLEVPSSFSSLQKELLKSYAANVSEEVYYKYDYWLENALQTKLRIQWIFLEANKRSADQYNNWENELLQNI